MGQGLKKIEPHIFSIVGLLNNQFKPKNQFWHKNRTGAIFVTSRPTLLGFNIGIFWIKPIIDRFSFCLYTLIDYCFILCIDQSRQWADGESPTDHLQNVIYNYASAVGIKKKDANLHLQLGMVLEEKYYIEDMFGLKKEVGVIFLFEPQREKTNDLQMRKQGRRSASQSLPS